MNLEGMLLNQYLCFAKPIHVMTLLEDCLSILAKRNVGIFVNIFESCGLIIQLCATF